MSKIKNKIENIWNNIDKKDISECWNWLGSLGNHGYGQISINWKKYLSHRIVYELTYGEIPEGMCICHKCDNRKCCNPEHLFLGTHQDNSNDMIAKGRQFHPIGELSSNRKLTEKDVLEIRRLYSTNNYSTRQLTKIFKISQTNISLIVNNKIWKHV
jgi:predicted XRE-type DNA-binding protein